jgi:hypothetical protein
MERRRQKRQSTDTAAVISYPPLGLLGARIRDLNNHGAFVQVSAVRLNLHSDIELIFTNDAAQKDTFTPMRARVVRSGDTGVALEFLVS